MAKIKDTGEHARGKVHGPAWAPKPMTSDEAALLWHLWDHLERICDHNDPAQSAAWSMAYSAIQGLITKDVAILAGAVRWSAWVRGAKDPQSNDLRMIWLAHHVRLCAELLHDQVGAKACAARLAPRVRKASAGLPPIETVADYAERWCAWRERKGFGCVGNDRAILRHHILPTIGTLDVCCVARDDLKRVVKDPDDKAKHGTTVDFDGAVRSFAWKTAINVWAVVRAMFRDTQRAKDVTLRSRRQSRRRSGRAGSGDEKGQGVPLA